MLVYIKIVEINVKEHLLHFFCAVFKIIPQQAVLLLAFEEG